MMSYRDQLRHPNWQRKRLEVLQHFGWKCRRCGDVETTLNVHHIEYRAGALAWEYETEDLECLCVHCHALEHGKAAPPVGTLSHKRSLWELIGSYHLAVCVQAADSGEMYSADEQSAMARRLCAADGYDYDALEAAPSE